ncbi:Thiosulfate sulfurtransferase PspE precursor [Sporotomaculum syntrophicum]|uniref:Thiosulfate sulfurtransferase PspE n=1 Tax=Sporotomaculum syntrophicum TaxID=182264 RepID=A0A9D2WQG0_9FIRM|nr:stalk domain-containing protein [Sporotomaculum syntrophicum]KAF1085041.1 Thiosulfate sulfurtransferase PspE precursor [Sporotomaculum syntrophicum]
MSNLKRKVVSCLLGIYLLFTFLPAVCAEELTDVTLSVNGKVLAVNSAAIVDNGTVLVPFRAVFEELGAAVTWDKVTKKAYATKENTIVIACIPCEFVSVNDEIRPISVPPRIVNDRVMIPANVVNGLFGASTAGTASDADTDTIKGTSAVEYKKITPEEAKAMMENERKQVTVIDVRSADEFASGHIEGALLIPVDDIEKLAAAQLPDKDATILVYCGSGVRSAKAANTN